MFSQTKKKIYLKTSSNFLNKELSPQKKNIVKNYSNKNLINNFDITLPLLSLPKKEKSKEKFIKTIKLKKSKFLKSQEKLNKLIKQEEKIKNFYLNIIKNKIKDEDSDFNSFVINSNDLIEEIPKRHILYNNYVKEKEKEKDKDKVKMNLRYENKVEREINKIYRLDRNLGKYENDCNDYIRRFKRLFPNKAIDEIDLKLKTESAILIQRFFREHKDKVKLYIGFEEPNYYIRIYINEYDIYPLIKTIEIKIYSTLFKININIIKSIEELFGVSSMNKEKIQKNIGIIFEKIIGNHRINKIKNINKDYYDESKADLSSDDFDDFEVD